MFGWIIFKKSERKEIFKEVERKCNDLKGDECLIFFLKILWKMER